MNAKNKNKILNQQGINKNYKKILKYYKTALNSTLVFMSICEIKWTIVAETCKKYSIPQPITA